MFSIIHGFRVIFCPKEIESEPVSPRIFFSRSPPLSQNLWPKASWGDNSRGERDSQKKIFKALFPLKSTHCGWRSIKLSHFQTFEFSCLKSTIKSITFKKRNIRIFHQKSKVNPHKNLHQFRSRSKNSIFGFLLQNWRFFAITQMLKKISNETFRGDF